MSDRTAESRLKKLVERAVELAREAGEFPARFKPDVRIEIPAKPQHGDYATSMALKAASVLGRSPMEIAETVASHIEIEEGFLTGAKLARPGFINFRIAPEFFIGTVRAVLEQKERYGRSDSGKGKRVLIEFISANPTGPLHIGHARQAVIGDVLASNMEYCGYTVDREYYFNDAGRQMDLLGESLWARYQQLFDRDVPLPEEGYRGEYIVEIARELKEERGDEFLGKELTEVLDLFRTYAAEKIIKMIDHDLRTFGIKFDSWFSESSLHRDGKTDEALETLREKGQIYEKDGAVWFRSSRFDDEKDRVVVRSDGTTTYFAPDIAYHIAKCRRGYDYAIDVMGADHHGYAPRMLAAMKALGYPDGFLEFVIHPMASFVRGGKEIKMSTRRAEFLTLAELVNEVGKDVARFLFTTRAPQSHLVFDFDLAKKQSDENPVYYVQYAYARICSILNHAEERGYVKGSWTDPDLKLLKVAEEIELAKRLYRFPYEVATSCVNRDLQRVPMYLISLVGEFHSYYNRHRVVTGNQELSLARLALVDAVRQVVHNGLAMLGISAPEKM
jgi:arginyl-tRNA synthetase